jgi:hypothetical protein
MKVFVTVANGQLFVQTNYVAPGQAYPAKLAIDSRVSLDEVVWNLITDDPSKVTRDEAIKAVRNDIVFYVDRFHLSQSSFSDLDFAVAKQIVWDPLASGSPQSPVPSASAVTQVAVQPQLTASPLPQPAVIDAAPKTLYEAAIQFLWSSLFGQILLLLFAAGSATLATWSALPSTIKTALVNRIFLKSQRRRSPPSKRRNSHGT